MSESEVRELLAKAREFGVAGYVATEDGRIWSCETNWRGYGARPLQPSLNRYGYALVRVTVGTRREKVLVHRAVATAFHGPRPTPKHEVRHLNGKRDDNRADNLGWGTRSENAKDRKVHGTEKAAVNGKQSAHKHSGSRHRRAKLSDVEVASIRRRFEGGERPFHIARDYPHISPFTINNVAKGRNYKTVLGEASAGGM